MGLYVQFSAYNWLYIPVRTLVLYLPLHVQFSALCKLIRSEF